MQSEYSFNAKDPKSMAAQLEELHEQYKALWGAFQGVSLKEADAVEKRSNLYVNLAKRYFDTLVPLYTDAFEAGNPEAGLLMAKMYIKYEKFVACDVCWEEIKAVLNRIKDQNYKVSECQELLQAIQEAISYKEKYYFPHAKS